MPYTTPTRRRFLAISLASGAALSAPVIFTGQSARAFTNAPTGSDVTFGFNVPLSGPYAAAGEEQLRGFELALAHLNGVGDGGMLKTFSSKALSGAGLLGKRIGYVASDTQSSKSVAKLSARAMIQSDGAIMISGGNSSAVAVAVQEECQTQGVIFMAGQTSSNDTTGKDKKANGFRHFYNSEMSARALVPIVTKLYGTDRKAYFLTADYNWGHTIEGALKTYTGTAGWEAVATTRTPLRQSDFRDEMQAVLQSDADVLVLSHFGANMMNSLSNASQLGLRERSVNGKEFEIIVPSLSMSMARGAGVTAARGIHGTINWHWSMEDEGSRAFTDSYAAAYGTPPGQSAHTCYVQTLLYADAATRAGSFDPCAVAEALEGFEFDGLGNGPTLYRGEDHQCIKEVLVVKGADAPSSDHEVLEIVEVTPRDKVTYDPALFPGELGACNSGA